MNPYLDLANPAKKQILVGFYGISVGIAKHGDHRILMDLLKYKSESEL
jgi:hypothetical protein